MLDTQILIWVLGNRRRLSSREGIAIEAADELLVSGLSLMELRIKGRAERRRGKPLSVPPPEHAIAFCAARDISIHPFTAADTAITLDVDPPHGDPFDEMLLAHTQALQARLLTRDAKLLRHPLAYQP
ncbi:type II toxin-antitoxin system VapC family toxin [Sphingomonas sp.]|uniref:type II toxin-antitoxin system VapC family toxin n=1 Tax=Sphingomonas sp. TaxID=28214 RepID=UPI003CC61D89